MSTKFGEEIATQAGNAHEGGEFQLLGGNSTQNASLSNGKTNY
jgi:hypothetical protein